MDISREEGNQCLEQIIKNAERYELTSIVFSIEQLAQGIDRIELRPRPEATVGDPVCYSQKIGKSKVFQHYIFYSKMDDRSAKATRRLDCAHELGHIVLHKETLRKGIMLSNDQEIEADWFAICLLQLHGYVNYHGRWDFPPVN